MLTYKKCEFKGVENMRIEEIEKLKTGLVYEFEVVEMDKNKPWKEVVNTYVGEYRGEDQEDDYLLFWIEGDTNAQPFHYGDINSFKIK